MTAPSSKCNGGQSYSTKCFPSRTLLRQRREGAGHWVAAYRNTKKQNYRNVPRRIKDNSKNNREAGAAGNTLDEYFLLHLHCVDRPSELCSVDISEQNLNSVKPEELEVFYNVVYIDASINSLRLGSFSSFGSLRELDLSVNRICNMMFDAADFPFLEVLNLSYNYLSNEDIVSIGRLPCLKVLHLTGNQLQCLLPELPATEDTLFSALEVLMLDDNKLSSEVFGSLTNLKRIKHLNLQGNCISEVPYLQLIGHSITAQTSVKEQAKQEPPASGSISKCVKRFECISEIIHNENWEEYSVFRSNLPLPELQFLNLADNKIAEEESLMAVVLFPKLCEIDINSNPLTTQRKGDPPLLTYYLQERLGIIIKREKPQDIVKLPLHVSTDPKLKVENRVPRVSKKPALRNGPHPAQIQVDKGEVTFKRAPEPKAKNKQSNAIRENTKHFFVTQADVYEYEFYLQADEKETPAKKEGDEKEDVPENVNYYKMLMDAKPNPGVVEHIGIQTAVRMLEHTLKNLNVYRDPKPKLDDIQTQYKEKERRIKPLPTLQLIRQPNKRVDKMIKEIKEATSIREVSLSSVLHGKGVNKKEYKDALLLLRDMKTKYKMVHKSTMEQAGNIESDRNTNISGAELPLRTFSNS